MYTSINDVPRWATSLVKDLISSGFIQCDNDVFEHPLTDDMLFLLLILSRKGII